MVGWPGVSERLPDARLRVLSMGAGVQSTDIALSCAAGEFEMPDCAVFADTGWEPAKVYRHLEWLERTLPFPIYRVRRQGRDLGEMSLAIARGEIGQKGHQMVPFYSGGGLSPKQCSKEFKTRPVARYVREMLALPPRRGCGPIVELWLGISTDELQRLKVNERPWIRNRYPLVEMRRSRQRCEASLAAKGVTAPRSSCIFCGYRTKREWLDVLSDPEDAPRLLAFDASIRTLIPGGAYLTPAHKPLAEIDFTEADDGQPSLFDNECEGMCGV